MNKDTFKHLADLMQKKDTLESEIQVARQAVEEEMRKAEADKVESEFGNFSFVVRKKWTYSTQITTQEAKLKELKKAEELGGTATCEELKFLTFRSPTSNPQADN